MNIFELVDEYGQGVEFQFYAVWLMFYKKNTHSDRSPLLQKRVLGEGEALRLCLFWLIRGVQRLLNM